MPAAVCLREVNVASYSVPGKRLKSKSLGNSAQSCSHKCALITHLKLRLTASCTQSYARALAGCLVVWGAAVVVPGVAVVDAAGVDETTRVVETADSSEQCAGAVSGGPLDPCGHGGAPALRRAGAVLRDVQFCVDRISACARALGGGHSGRARLQGQGEGAAAIPSDQIWPSCVFVIDSKLEGGCH